MTHNTALAITVEDSSQVGEARRTAAALGLASGMSETKRGYLALVVTEAGNNLVRHAGGGRILLQTVTLHPDANQTDWIDVFALDTGPGIRNVASAMRDGHSTAGTAGQGLGAIARHSAVFDAFSAPDKGTVLFSRLFVDEAKAQQTAPFDFGVVCLPYPGEVVCGDGWAIQSGGDGAVRLLVTDGLGHGSGASEASMEAVRLFDIPRTHNESPAQTLERMHNGLHHTRGAAAALACVEQNAVTFAGVGNIQAALVTGDETHGLASFNGTIGHQARKFTNMNYAVKDDPFLVMASDGLNTQWRLTGYPGLFNRHPAVIAALILRDFSRERDDATVLVAKLNTTENTL